MSMRKITYFLATVFLPVVLSTGCYEDKSSDRYDPFGEITVTDIETSYYQLVFVDHLKITPKVVSTHPQEKFDYLWTIYKGNTLLDTIADQKDLDWLITLDPGAYSVVLRVTNAANNYAEYFKTTLTAATPFMNGFYFLKETPDGNTEMDFRYPEGEMVYDLLKARLGAPLRGAPNKLSIVKQYSYTNVETTQFVRGTIVFPTSKQEAVLLLINDISLIYDHRSMFYGEEPHEVPHAIFYTFQNPFYISSLAGYLTQQTTYTLGSGKFGFPTSPAGGESAFSKYMILSPTSAFPLALFDEKGGRLIRYMYSNTVFIDTPGITHKFLFMGAKSSQADGWMIFEDRANPSQRYLYFLKNGSMNTVDRIENLDPALNFSKASLYGSNKTGGTNQMLYGVVGSKIYMYNTAAKTEKLLAPEGFDTNVEITMLTHKNGAGEYLVIGTYKSGRYKVYMYKMAGGEPTGPPEVVAEGEGRVVDVQHTATSGQYVNY